MAYTPDTLVIAQDTTQEDTKQLVDLMFPVFFGTSVHNRKDSNSIKFTVLTGGDSLNVLIYKSTEEDPIFCGTISSTILEERIVDICETVGITKSWQVRLVGLLSEFKLSEIAIDYDDRPEPLTFKRVPWADLGPNKKRVRVWPVTLDGITEDNEITIIPYVDGVAQPVFEVSCNYPKTHLYQFHEDVFGIDYAISIHSCEVFELYKIHEPTGVQTLPIAKHFDQVGSTELFRYGKLRSFVVRIIAFGGTVIPWRIIFEDDVELSGTITVVDGKEDTFKVDVPKTTAGQVLRIEFGPTEFNFHRFYVRVQAMRSGKDTENEWIDLE